VIRASPERGAQKPGRESVEVAQSMRDKVQEITKAVAGRGRPRVFVAEWTDPP
jgi:hypothetical protein